MFTLRALPMALSPMGTMGRELDGLFDDLSDWTGAAATYPALNLWEEGDQLVAEAETPGFRRDDLDISVQNNLLTIKGKREAIATEKDATYHRRERVAREFERTIALPYEVASDKVEATLRDGVLTITLPKAEVARTRKIAVKSE
jgi:HSP20 family protein